MRDQPDGKALIDLAREVLRDRIAPALSGDLRYQALMAANALSIAGRQVEAGPEDHAAEIELLASLVELDLDGGGLFLLAAGLRRLSLDIRGGAADPGQPKRAAIHAYLVDSARARLAEVNPRALSALES